MKKTCLLLAAAALVAVSATQLQAQPYYVAGGALTPAWAPGTPELQLTGSPLSLTTNTTTGYHEFKITGATWSDPNWPSSNCKINGDANGSNTFYFYPGTIGDGWFPLANRVGYENPGNAWEISGDFTSPNWGDDAAALMSVAPGTNYLTVNYVVPSVGTHNFKFKTPGTWEGAVGQDFGMSSANISFATVTPNQSVEFNFDPAKGRYLINIPPVTNTVVFAVDMSSQIQLGLFDTNTDSVFVSGGFNGWPGTGPGALVLTNMPLYNNSQNPNIYYGTNTFIGLPSSLATYYKFTDNNPGMAGYNGYEQRAGGDRSFNLLTTNGPLILPVVSFGDVTTSDYLSAPLNVTFRVDMNGRTNIYGVLWAGQNIYINGNFRPGGWSGTWNNLVLSQMFEEGVGSGIFTNTFEVPTGNPIDIKYKYCMDDGVNGFDNEAPTYQDHGRTIRTTVTGSYNLATDTFGVQYVEPSFGQLAAGSPSGGTMPLTWLGRPGVYVQSSTNVNGPWVNHINTDGTNWNIGTYGTNGLISTTNWPTTGAGTFFRLIKP